MCSVCIIPGSLWFCDAQRATLGGWRVCTLRTLHQAERLSGSATCATLSCSSAESQGLFRNVYVRAPALMLVFARIECTYIIYIEARSVCVMGGGKNSLREKMCLRSNGELGHTAKFRCQKRWWFASAIVWHTLLYLGRFFAVSNEIAELWRNLQRSSMCLVLLIAFTYTKYEVLKCGWYFRWNIFDITPLKTLSNFIIWQDAQKRLQINIKNLSFINVPGNFLIRCCFV